MLGALDALQAQVSGFVSVLDLAALQEPPTVPEDVFVAPVFPVTAEVTLTHGQQPPPTLLLFPADSPHCCSFPLLIAPASSDVLPVANLS